MSPKIEKNKPTEGATTTALVPPVLDGLEPSYLDAIELRATLLNIQPAIWRRLHVPARLSLAALHQVLQVAFGWTDSHLHDFDVQGIRFATPDVSDEIWAVPEQTAPLGAVAKRGATIRYLYDYGDSWEHEITVLGLVEGAGGIVSCVAGERACPPEDCGGTSGYAHLCEVLADPTHPEHKELRTWVGGRFHPEKLDLGKVNRELLRLGKRLLREADRGSG